MKKRLQRNKHIFYPFDYLVLKLKMWMNSLPIFVNTELPGPTGSFRGVLLIGPIVVLHCHWSRETLSLSSSLLLSRHCHCHSSTQPAKPAFKDGGLLHMSILISDQRSMGKHALLLLSQSVVI